SACSEGVRPGVVLCSAVATACEKGRSWSWSLQMLAAARKLHLELDTVVFSAAVSGCEKCSAWSQALALHHSLRVSSLRPDAIAYNAAAAAAAAVHVEADKATAAQPWEISIGLLKDMQLSGIRATCISYNTAAGACHRGGSWRLGLGLLRAARAAQLGSELIAYTEVVGACEKHFQWMWALQLLRHMRRRRGGLKLDVAAHSALSSALGAARQWESALGLGDVMRCSGLDWDTQACNVLLAVCEKMQRWELAVALLRELPGRRLMPDSLTQSAASRVLDRGQQWEMALQLLSGVGLCNLQSLPEVEAYNAASSACEKGREWQQGLAVFSLLRRRSLQADIVTFGSAISNAALCRWELAVQILDLALHAGMGLSLAACNAAIGACASTGSWRAAAALLAASAQSLSLRPDLVTLKLVASAWESSASSGAALPSTAALGQLVFEAADGLMVRLRSPASGRSGPGSLVRAVEAAEILCGHGQVTAQVQAAFARSVGRPVLQSLRSMRGQQRTWSADDPALLRQFSLGVLATADVLEALGLRLALDNNNNMEALQTAARLATRRQLRACAVEASLLDPAALELPSWLALRAQQDAGQTEAWGVTGSVGRTYGFGSLGWQLDSGRQRPPLDAVFVDHDRGPHAERQALLSAASILLLPWLSLARANEA
ncbi:unnamed protein product, partial [Polarella glacialis]